ncbi:MAG TPA: phage repressor protein/antirepressor Ant [Candidatus Atribacteria bacterium]|nr:phage repressor protein/antirepressor Ant [Candidatus Atribacteria bacterium]
MNEITVFENENFGKIRTLVKEDEVWFVGKDICQALEYSNTSKAINDHVDIEDRYNETLERGGTILIINESGLYSLILRSKKPEAKKFKRWVTSEVLPSIRKHGAYMTEQTLERALTDPDFLIQLATQLKEEQQRRKALEIENQVMKPKAEYFDSLVDRELLTNFRDTAKELGIGQKYLVNWLLENSYLYRDAKGKLKAYQCHIDKGLFEYKDFVRGKYASTQTLVTVKGKETFRLLLLK